MEKTLRLCILNAVDQVDEIIAVFNDSVDKTEEILTDLEMEYPNIIKVFKYVPKVYPPNDCYYKNNKITKDDPHTLSHYYNFALSKTTYSHVCKFDDDNLMFPNSFRQSKEDVEKLGDKMSIGLKGINICDVDQKLYVDKNFECTGGADTLMFKYNSSCHFKQTIKYEVFKSNIRLRQLRTCFYHLKFCKKDRGFNNYEANKNTSSRYIQMFKDRMSNTDLITLDEYRMNKNIPDPFDMNFMYINESNKVYAYELFNEIDKETFKNIKLR
jgi:hypothetical protein